MLDDHSKRVSAALLARYPQWAANIGTRSNPDGTQHLVVTVPRPIEDDPVGGLVIDSENREITVECGQHYHDHFQNYDSGVPGDLFEFLDEVVAEEIVFARMQRGDIVLGGRSLDPAAARALIGGGPWPELRGAIQPDTLWLWSWRGTFDARLHPAA